jgi:hypothetical protein
MQHLAASAGYKTKTLLAWNLLADLFAGRLDGNDPACPAKMAALAALNYGSDAPPRKASGNASDHELEDDVMVSNQNA